MVVYLTTHLPTGKMYIGKDKNNHHRYFGSGVDIKNIIKTEGRDSLKKSILEECDDLETLNQREEYWLKYYDAENNPMFLNRTNKAYGCSRQTEEGKRKISENRTPFIWTKEMREKASKQRIGKTKLHLNTRSDKGVKRSQEWKDALSKSLKDKPKEWLRKKVGQYTLDGELIKIYNSAQEAKNETSIEIKNVVTNRAKSAGGFIWKYEE
jgi:hypothetical protein|tara:strand:+ start:50 stop:679 length:630 start_codon:yes stop_codon:yes gene_type:complete